MLPDFRPEVTQEFFTMKQLSRWATVVALLAVPSALATVVIAETIEEMARASAVVVRGRVVQVQPLRQESTRHIYTYADVQVIEVLKGPDKLASVLVKQPGGEIGDRGTHVAGAGHFAVGEDAVLFLEAATDEPNVFILRALSAGKVDIQRSAKGEVRAIRRLGGLAFYETRPVKDPLRVVKPEEDFGPPEIFLTRIRNALRDGGGR